MENLVEQFEKELRKLNDYNSNVFLGTSLNFPIIVIYLGEESTKIHTMLYQVMSERWMPYQNDLLFFGVKDDKTFFSLQSTEKEMHINEIDEKSVLKQIQYIYRANSNFKNFNKILVFYITDTCDMKTAEEYHRNMDLCRWSQKIIQLTNPIYTKISLLNQNMGRESDNKIILEQIKEEYETNKNENIYLLSNKRLDGTFIEGYDRSSHIITDIIALSDGEDDYLASNMLIQGVKTVGYALYEKPFHDISQVLTLSFLEKLRDIRTMGNVVGTMDQKSKFGITEQGTFLILDDYCKRNLFESLLQKEILEWFPTQSCVTITDEMNEEDVNRHTMGTWNLYLKNSIRNRIDAERENMFQECVENYRAYLSDHITMEEFLWLNKHKDIVEQVFEKKIEYKSQNRPVLQEAKKRICYEVSSTKELRDVLLGCLQEEIDKRVQLETKWRQFMQQAGSIILQGDPDLQSFYRRKVQNYFELNESEIRKTLDTMKQEAELEIFVNEQIRNLLQSDSIFAMNLEEELEERKNAITQPLIAKTYIRNQLIEEKVYIYNPVAMGSKTKNVSCMLLSDRTSFYTYLNATLQEYHYYNTGDERRAESLNVYSINSNML